MGARLRYTGLLLAAVLLASLLSTGNAPAQAQNDAVAAAPVAPAQNGAQGPTIVGSDSPLVSTVPETLPWGVVEMGDWTHISTNLRVPVYDIQQIGDRVFVAGSFGKIQKGPGGRQVDQSFVAAFDLATGNLIEDWRPTVNATVYALAATDDGKLIIGGDFTQVNGQPHTAAMAALNALTGDLAAGFRSGLERPWSQNEPVVRDLEVHGAYIYAAGNFSHQVSLASRTRVYKAMRVSQVNGDLDTSWVPHVTGAGLWSMSVSPDGSRVTLGGFQTAINAQPNTDWIGVVSGATGNTVTGLVHEKTHPSSAHVQGIYDDGDKLFYTGSQHYIFQVDTTTWQREEGTTYYRGGDGQAIEIMDGIIYNACHCFLQNAYTDSYDWPTPTIGSTEHDVNGVSAHTRNNFTYIDAFQPEIYYADGEGPWALHGDTRGCLWVGGDVSRLNDDPPYRWAGGFTRLCQDDARPPTAPGNPRVSFTGLNQNEPVLTWQPSVDNRDVVAYQVYRSGLLLDTVTDTTFADGPIAAPATYRIRAVDARGNISATSESIVASPLADSEVLVAAGSTWRYLDNGSNPGSNWYQTSFNDGAWKSGAGQLGFGDGDEATTVATGNVQNYFRTTFNVADPNANSLNLELLADDGAVVYLNGIEVLRDNIAAGPLGFPTWPTGWKSGNTENVYQNHVIANQLVAGTNTLAVSVHNVSGSNNDFGFDLRLVKSSNVAAAGPLELVAAGDTWRYLDNGSNPGATWRQTGFNDANWSSGAGQLGYGEGDEATVIAEGQPRHITAYFRNTFTVANAADFATIDIGLLRDDGAVVYLNGVELVRDNMPAGTITSTTGASGYTTGNGERTYHSFTVPASALNSGTNVIAVEVHQTDPWSKDFSFDLTATAKP